MTDIVLRHGAFLAPFHYIDESPTIGFRRDLELTQWLDQLGYDEMWYGEHHSGGYETISSPELMIAAAAEMTKRIRLGTGVVSLSYHNPLMVANRIMQLDHMTMGRIMFGVGPGLLPSDAAMMAVESKVQREMMAASLEAIIRLFRGEEVTLDTPWWKLDQAKIHILPFSRPHPEISVASAVTPSGGMVAGKMGLGMLCVAATGIDGFDVLGSNWEIACSIAASEGRTMDPGKLRLVGPMHIAETREKAREDVRFGLEKWVRYFDRASPLGMENKPKGGHDIVDTMIETGRAVIGTPDDAFAQIERLKAKQGAFGAFLHQGHDWADWEPTKRSYELYARYVIPKLSGVNANRISSFNFVVDEGDSLKKRRQPGIDAAFQKWEKTKQDLNMK